MARVQVVLDEREREEYRAIAKAEGLSLSAWFKRAARAYAEQLAAQRQLKSADDVRAFLRRVRPEKGREPDWDDLKDDLINARIPDDFR